MGRLNVQPISAPQEDPVLRELERVLADHRFAASPSLIRFLRYTVLETLAGRTRDLREGPLGLSVFDRGDNFDPRTDPIVRVQAGKLRTRLQDYYEHEGAADPIRIELPRGSYIPRFVPRPSSSDPAAPEPSAAAGAGATSAAAFRKNWTGVAAGAAAALALVAAVVWIWGVGRRSAVPLELTRLTYEAGSTMWPVVSRDGRLLAYSSDRGKGNLNIWVRPLHGGTPVLLSRQESPALSPDFSPDGMQIAFRTRRSHAGDRGIPALGGGGGIVTVSVLGGEERRITEMGWLPRFSPDGAWIAYQGVGALCVVPSAGGQWREVASADFELRGGPLWAADGKRLLALGAPRSVPEAKREYDWYSVPWTGGQPVPVGLRDRLRAQGLPGLDAEARPGDWLGDSIVFSLKRGHAVNIWKVPVNPRTLRVAGPAVQLTSGSAAETQPRCSAAGQLVFMSEAQMTHIYSLRVDPSGRAMAAPEQLTEDASLGPLATIPRLSADGGKLSYASSRSGAPEIVTRDLGSGTERAAAAPARQNLSLLGGDASLLVYQSREPNRQVLYLSEPGQPFSEKAGEPFGAVHDWSRDGRRVVLEDASRSALIVWDRDANKRTEWLKYPAETLRQAALSADRNWLAMVFSEPAGGFVAPLASAPLSPAQLIRVASAPRLASMHWSADGSLLYYFAYTDDHNCLWAQRLDAARHPAGAPVSVAHFHSNRLSAWGTWIAAGADRLVFPLTELRSDIWMAAPAGLKTAAPATALR